MYFQKHRGVWPYSIWLVLLIIKYSNKIATISARLVGNKLSKIVYLTFNVE